MIEEAPAWLLNLLPKAGRRTKGRKAVAELDTDAAIGRATHYLLHEAPTAQQGDGGDFATYRVACKVRDFGLSEAMIFNLMAEHWNGAKADPPWDIDDLQEKAARAERYAQNVAGVASAEADFEPVEIGQNPSGRAGLDVESGLKEITPLLGIRDLGALNWTPKQNYLVRDLLNYGMIGLITGDSNAGKSPFALDLAAHVATGKPWHGRKVRKGYVLYLFTEGWSGLENRLEAVRRTHFGDSDQPAIGYAALSLNLREPGPVTKQIIEAVNQNAARFGVPPALVIVDTLSHTLGGGSDKDDDVARAVIKTCQRIVAGTGATVLFTHHPTKQVGGSDYRGSSVWTNDTDIRIRIEVEPNGVRKVTTPRVKESREIDPPLRFRIKILELGKDIEGDAVTSVVVEWLTEFDAPMELSPDGQRALDAFDDLVSEREMTDKIISTQEWNEAISSTLRGGQMGKCSLKTFQRMRTEVVTGGHVKRYKNNQWVRVEVDKVDRGGQ